MSDLPKNPSPDMLKCPLCEGRGEVHKADLVDRLSEKDLGRKVANFLSIVEAEQKESLHGVPPRETNSNVTSWNLTHFLWRRSPKE
jgi:hypothetical protein